MTTRKYNTTEKRIWQKPLIFIATIGVVGWTITSFIYLIVYSQPFNPLPGYQVYFPDLSHEVLKTVRVEEVKKVSPQEEHALLLREIVYQSVLAGVDPISALKIAKCESRYDEAAKNKNSSAKGLYQFIDRTWKGYCTGDPLVAEDSINCFVKLYKQYPSWWVCKG